MNIIWTLYSHIHIAMVKSNLKTKSLTNYSSYENLIGEENVLSIKIINHSKNFDIGRL